MDDNRIELIEWHRDELSKLLATEDTHELKEMLGNILEKATQRVRVRRGGTTFWREQKAAMSKEEIFEFVRTVKNSMNVNKKTQIEAERVLVQGENVIRKAKISMGSEPEPGGILFAIRSKKAIRRENAKYAVPEVEEAMMSVNIALANATAARIDMDNRMALDMPDATITKERKIAILAGSKKHLDIMTDGLRDAITTAKTTIDSASIIGSVMQV